MGDTGEVGQTEENGVKVRTLTNSTVFCIELINVMFI